MTAQSPLMEANPASIDELFNRDPAEITDAEVTRLVAELRKARTNWLVTDEVKKSKPKLGAPSKDDINKLLEGL